jgi:predicted phage baseplate assembly protein
MTQPNRAVSLSDYETLAMQTPGTRLARASARANLHPSFPCYRAPGIITLIILPYLPVTRPMPSAGLIQAVLRYINRRRVIGTRVEVIGPTYREITVRATVQAFPGVNIRDVQERILAALKHFFDPLPSAESAGWEFGRDVYRSEVLQLLDGTPGLDHVDTMELLADGGEPQCGNVCLPPNGLVFEGKHRITVNGGTGCP